MSEEKNKRSLIHKFVLAASLSVAATGFILGGLSGVGLSDEAGARNILKKDGYTEAEYKGKASLLKSCGGSLFYRDAFNAKNLAGNKVDVTVCQGPLKSMEIKQWKIAP